MIKAVWNGVILAESDQTIIVEGNHYFPPGSIREKYIQKSETHTICGWKGVANYYNIQVDGETNMNAAWYYSSPKEAVSRIAGYVAFWKGVEVREE